MGKGTKLFFIVLVLIVFATMGIVICNQVQEDMEEEKQTETYQIALDYLMNTSQIQEKYGSGKLPELKGVSKHSWAEGYPDHIKYLFVFDPLPFSNIGDQYTVELRKEFGEWVVVQVQNGSHMKISSNS